MGFHSTGFDEFEPCFILSEILQGMKRTACGLHLDTFCSWCQFTMAWPRRNCLKGGKEKSHKDSSHLTRIQDRTAASSGLPRGVQNKLLLIDLSVTITTALPAPSQDYRNPLN